MIGLHRAITLVHNTRASQSKPKRQRNRIPILVHSLSAIIIYNCLYRGLLCECMLICLYLCLSIYWLLGCISKVFDTDYYAFKSCLLLVFVIGLVLRWSVLCSYFSRLKFYDQVIISGHKFCSLPIHPHAQSTAHTNDTT